MKKILSCLLAIVIISICVVPGFAAEAPSLSISASKLQVNTGDVITVNVGISANSGLGTLNFSINYNSSEFEYVAGSAQASTLFGEPVINDKKAGSVLYVGAIAAEDGLQAGGSLVSVQLKVLKNGGVISLSVNDATDANDEFVTVTKTSVNLSCAHSKMDWKVTKKATCTAKGTETGTCPCGHTATREIEKTAHTYTESVVKTEPTCTKNGVRVGTCTVCKASGAESVIPAKGHNYTDWVVTKEPTMITMGVKERVCRTCNDKQTQMVSSLNENQTPEITLTEEPSTEITTNFDPFFTTQPNADTYFEIETEATTEPSGGLFGNSDFTESDMAALIVIVLAILLVVILVVYILLLRQRKR